MKKLLYSLASFSSFGLFFPSFLIGSSNPYGNYSAQEMSQPYLGPSTPFEAEYAPPAEQGGFAQQGHPQSRENFGPQLRDAEYSGYHRPPEANPESQIMGQPESFSQQAPIPQSPSEQLITLLSHRQYFSTDDIDISNDDLSTLLAKINESGKFNGKIDFQSVNLTHGKKTLNLISRKIPVIFLRVNSNGLFKPFFFIDLSFLLHNGNNTCKSGRLFDDNVRNALSNSTLGSGEGWKNKRTLSNWHQLLAQGRALFFVEFNNQLFVLVLKTDVNEDITDITSENWNTSLGKKILMGTGAAAATGAAALGTYYGARALSPLAGALSPLAGPLLLGYYGYGSYGDYGSYGGYGGYGGYGQSPLLGSLLNRSGDLFSRAKKAITNRISPENDEPVSQNPSEAQSIQSDSEQQQIASSVQSNTSQF